MARLQLQQGQGVALELVDLDTLALALAAAHEFCDPSNHLAGPLGLLTNAVHGLANVAPRLIGWGLLQQVERAVGIAGNGGQGLIELVADHRGHFSSHGQAGGGL